jgi:hypothetical protein
MQSLLSRFINVYETGLIMFPYLDMNNSFEYHAIEVGSTCAPGYHALFGGVFMSTESSVATGQHVINYTVNDEPQQTHEQTLTPKQIMTLAGIKPDENYLVEIEGRHRESYQDKPDKPIHMHEHQKFVSVFTGSVPVS